MAITSSTTPEVPSPASLSDDTRLVIVVAALASCAISLWLTATTDTLNKDAILYLRMAGLILQGNWQDALALYDMPLLPALIAAVSVLTTLTLANSAYLLMAILYGGIAAVVVRLVKQIGGTAQHQWIVVAALLSHQTLNQYRETIIRDPGAWLCSLLAILWLLRWLKHNDWRFITGFAIATLLAAFWRLESLVLLLLPPAIAIMRRDFSPSRLIMPGLLLIVACAAIGGLFYGIHGKQLWQGLHVKLYLQELYGIADNFEHARGAIASQVLLTNSSPQIIIATLMVYISSLIMILIEVAGPLLFLIIAWSTMATRSESADSPLSPHFILIRRIIIAIGISYLFVLLLTLQFLVPRYAMLIGFMVLVGFPFYVTRLINSAHSLRSRRFRTGVVGCLLALGFLDSVISISPGKYNIRDAATWMGSELPHDRRLVTNSHHIGWHSGMVVDWTLVNTLDRDPTHSPTVLDDYGYYAIAIKRRDADWFRAILLFTDFETVRIFDAHPGDIVWLLQTNSTEGTKQLSR